jgi:hypothetical protein
MNCLHALAQQSMGQNIKENFIELDLNWTWPWLKVKLMQQLAIIFVI